MPPTVLQPPFEEGLRRSLKKRKADAYIAHRRGWLNDDDPKLWRDPDDPSLETALLVVGNIAVPGCRSGGYRPRPTNKKTGLGSSSAKSRR
jgi:hypothetical protein